jgi:hypothetical protein
MRSNDLTREQIDNLAGHIKSMLAYLQKLEQRIAANDFPADDPLRIASKEAFDAMASLVLRVQCLKITDSSQSAERLLPADMLGPKPRKHWKRYGKRDAS